MKPCRQHSDGRALRPWAGRGLGVLCLRRTPAAVPWLLLLLLLLQLLILPAARHHGSRAGAGALEPTPDHTALLMLLPECLVLRAPDTLHIDIVCPCPVPAAPPRAPVLTTAPAVALSFPRVRRVCPFPLRV